MSDYSTYLTRNKYPRTRIFEKSDPQSAKLLSHFQLNFFTITISKMQIHPFTEC